MTLSLFRPSFVKIAQLAFTFAFSLTIFGLANDVFAQKQAEQTANQDSEVNGGEPDISPNVVISEVYGGGGNAGAPFNRDFVEIANKASAPVTITGFSIQYASATGTTWEVQAIPTFTIQPGRRILIALGPTGATGAALPAPDVNGSTSITLAATAGKIALVNSTTPLTGSCPTGNATIVDFVGYGTTANCAEIPTGTVSGNSRLGVPTTGQTAPAPSNTTSIQRINNATIDRDNNAIDFITGAPNPQNSAAAATAAGVIVGGRVTNVDGRGLDKVMIIMTDGNGEVRYALTNPFGYYRFADVPAGETYIFTAVSKRYQFTQPTQILSVTGQFEDLNFTAMAQ